MKAATREKKNMNADIKLSKIKEKWKKQCEQRMTSKSEHQKRKRNGKIQPSQIKYIYIFMEKKLELVECTKGDGRKKNWRRNQ